MDAGPAADDGEIADLAMAREHHVVGEHDVAAHPAIMRDVGIGQEEAAIPDDRRSRAVHGARIHRHAFADDAILADHEGGRLALVAQVLRRVADRREGKDPGPGTHDGVAIDHGVAHELAAVAELDIRPNHAIRADPDIVPYPRLRIDDGGRMDVTREAQSPTSIALT